MSSNPPPSSDRAQRGPGPDRKQPLIPFRPIFRESYSLGNRAFLDHISETVVTETRSILSIEKLEYKNLILYSSVFQITYLQNQAVSVHNNNNNNKSAGLEPVAVGFPDRPGKPVGRPAF